MKRLLAFSVLALLVACQKKYNNNATVIRDCTGVYIRCQAQDMPVCNSEILVGIADGTSINATFKLVDDNDKCAEREKVHCMMIHSYEIGAWIKITRLQ